MSAVSAKTRRNAAIAVGVLIVAGTTYTAVKRGAFDAALLAIASFGLLVAALQALPRRPRLQATFAEGGSATDTIAVAGGATVRPLDVGAIVGDEREKAYETAPPRPRPDRIGISQALVASAFTPSDADYEAFAGTVKQYTDHLRQWLGEVDVRRRPVLQEVHADVRLHNVGDCEATNARVRLFFPKDWQELDDEDENVEDSPERPEWGDEFGLLGRPIRVPRIRSFPRIELPRPSRGGLRGPTYYRDAERLVVEYTIRHLSAGLTEQSGYPMELRPPGGGSHEVAYEVYADGLRAPSRGVLHINVGDVGEAGQPITRLDELRDPEDDED